MILFVILFVLYDLLSIMVLLYCLLSLLNRKVNFVVLLIKIINKLVVKGFSVFVCFIFLILNFFLI